MLIFVSNVVLFWMIPCKASECCLHCGKLHRTYLVSGDVSNAKTVLENRFKSSLVYETTYGKLNANYRDKERIKDIFLLNAYE